MEISQIKELLALGKEFGLKQINLAEFQAIFHEPVGETLIPGESIKIPTDEEFLYMSSGFDPKEEQELKTG